MAGVQRPGLPGHGGRAGGGDVPLSRVLGVSVAVCWVSPPAEDGAQFFWLSLLSSLSACKTFGSEVQVQIHLNFYYFFFSINLLVVETSPWYPTLLFSFIHFFNHL